MVQRTLPHPRLGEGGVREVRQEGEGTRHGASLCTPPPRLLSRGRTPRADCTRTLTFLQPGLEGKFATGRLPPAAPSLPVVFTSGSR